MTLRELLSNLNVGAKIRIFAGCMTLYHGKAKFCKEWMLKVVPYMGCQVISHKEINGTIVIAI